jgi:hypothetical protein
MMRDHWITISRQETMDQADLHEEIAQLPEQYRRPIILCYMQGLTQMQAAEKLGWPLGTVQIRLHRGRECLRSRLIRRDPNFSSTALLTSLTATTGIPPRSWREVTARAAVRFATGNETTGLVTPAVSGMAKSILASMLYGPLKVIASLQIVLLLAWAGLSLSGLLTVKAKFSPSSGGSGLLKAELIPTRAVRNHLLRIDPVAGDDKKLNNSQSVSPARHVSSNRPRTAARLADRTVDEHLHAVTPLSVRPSTDGSIGSRPERMLATGRELFERVWIKDDPRGHGGDGLGPVFNGQACVACHNLGGSGGAGGIERNIEIANLSGNVNDTLGFSYGQATGFSYWFSMDFGAGRFEYRIGGQPSAAARRETRVDTGNMAAIHPGFRDARSVVLHRYGTDPAYTAWRGSVPGQHGSIMVQTSERNPPPLFGAGLIDAIPDAVIEAA